MLHIVDCCILLHIAYVLFEFVVVYRCIEMYCIASVWGNKINEKLLGLDSFLSFVQFVSDVMNLNNVLQFDLFLVLQI